MAAARAQAVAATSAQLFTRAVRLCLHRCAVATKFSSDVDACTGTHQRTRSRKKCGSVSVHECPWQAHDPETTVAVPKISTFPMARRMQRAHAPWFSTHRHFDDTTSSELGSSTSPCVISRAMNQLAIGANRPQKKAEQRKAAAMSLWKLAMNGTDAFPWSRPALMLTPSEMLIKYAISALLTYGPEHSTLNHIAHALLALGPATVGNSLAQP
mmetsp:Transcript_87798/g.226318  ORF Transcript_87798/g.226318 Transcript_87798/m.226318 type:complete len:213 (+) Transcript_87798:80-718(+)